MGLTILILVLLVITCVSVIIAVNTRRLLDAQKAENVKLLSQKKSSEVRTGQIAEQLAPFLKEFKYNPKRTHFLGMPIDFVIFEDDKIVFLEIKSGKAQLSQTQKNIKALVKAGKVSWDEMRIDGKDNINSNGEADSNGMSETPEIQGSSDTGIELRDLSQDLPTKEDARTPSSESSGPPPTGL